jgi:hypothetical protein
MEDQPGSAHAGEDGVHHIDEHVCLDLLQGLLSPAGEKRVLAHISDCASCESLFQAMAAESARVDATMAVRSLPDGEIMLERRGTAVRRTQTARAPTWYALGQWWEYVRGLFLKPRYRLAGAVAVALAITMRVLLPQYLGPSQSPDLYMLPLYAFTLETRDVVDHVPEDLRAGLDAYQDRDFEGAIDLLTKPTLSDLEEPEDAIRQIFLGSALAWDGDYSAAAEVLGAPGLELVPGKWGHEARWTLYVSLRESGRTTAASSLLQALAKEPGDVGGRARRVLDSMNR